MPPQTSLIMTVFNRERYLSDAINSVLSQTQPDFELIIWDDGSSDRSVDIARSYAQKDERVRLFAGDHQGHLQALKAAHAAAIGAYIGWVDSDDLLAPTALAETSAVLNRHPTVGMVYTNYLVIDQDNRIKRLGRVCCIPYSPKRLLSYFMTFHFRLMRRAVYDQVGGVDSQFHYSEDYDLCLKLSEVTEIYHLKRPLYYYRKHGDSISRQHHAAQKNETRKIIAQALERRGRGDRPISR
jgi:glycosyltransferase involved in cell wall biosynthesis